jgi:hypothetical protein
MLLPSPVDMSGSVPGNRGRKLSRRWEQPSHTPRRPNRPSECDEDGNGCGCRGLILPARQEEPCCFPGFIFNVVMIDRDAASRLHPARNSTAVLLPAKISITHSLKILLAGLGVGRHTCRGSGARSRATESMQAAARGYPSGKGRLPLPSRYFALAQVPRRPRNQQTRTAPCPKQVLVALPLRVCLAGR